MLLYEIETNKATGAYMLDNVRMFLFSGHGNTQAIFFGNEYLTNSDINNLSLNRLEFVFLNACLTGKNISPELNILQANVAKAPNPNVVAVGFTHVVWSFTSNNWSNAFFDYLSQGETVDWAVDRCNSPISFIFIG